jgi:hypothetical protein
MVRALLFLLLFTALLFSGSAWSQSGKIFSHQD